MTVPELPRGVDHLVYAVPVLEEGLDRIEALLGVRPVAGGRHPDAGSHNALLGLGSETYLEVIAADPGLPRPARGLPFGMEGIRAPSLATWALRSESIDAAVESARAQGTDPGVVAAGRRERPDGMVLTWRLSDPWAMLLGGVVPFLISWGETPHPAGVIPSGGTLVGLRADHPDPERARAALTALGVDMEVRAADAPGLVARIRTGGGEVVELR